MAATVLSCTILCCPSSLPPSTTFFHPQTFISATSCCINSVCHNKLKPAQQPLISLKARQFRNIRPVNLSASDSFSPENTERWILQPVGDGDTRHLGFKVPMPDAFEISSMVVTVGRSPEKADMVIPVATVSGLHARIEKKEGSLLVTDLDSTNGTFINDKKLRPGAVATVLPGNRITFGDNHLAMFLLSKLENVDLPSKPDDSAVPENNPNIVNEESS